MNRGTGKSDKVFSLENPIKFALPDHRNTIYRFSERLLTNGITSDVILTTTGAYYFMISQMNNFTTFASLFDSYRIVRVEVMIIPRGITSSTGTNPGRFTTVIDYDDAVSPTNEAECLQYANALTSSGADGHYRSFTPCVALAAYSGTFTSYESETAPWIDVASSTVQHYGLKWCWSPTDSTYQKDVIVNFHTEWRTQR
jgi:hypothetical protein